METYLMKNCLYFIPVILFFLFAMYMSYTEPPKPVIEKVGHGKASKVAFEGHSYVIWQQNFSDCIVHDPNCKCRVKEK